MKTTLASRLETGQVEVDAPRTLQVVESVQWHTNKGYLKAVDHIHSQVAELDHLRAERQILKQTKEAAISEANSYCDRLSDSTLLDYRSTTTTEAQLRGIALGASTSVVFKHFEDEGDVKQGDKTRLVSCVAVIYVPDSQCVRWWVPEQIGGDHGLTLENTQGMSWTIQACVQPWKLLQKNRFFLVRFEPKVPTA
jgi:hypothetical protein